MLKTVYLSIFTTLLLGLSGLVHSESQTPEERGLEIALKVREANDGFIGETSDMQMVLIDAYGVETVREMSGMTLEVTGDGDRSLMTFQSPADVQGTKMLTWSRREGSDDQWLYLPALRRVRRISSSNRMSSFMGSEFSFEDLGSQEVERYDFKYLKDAEIEDEAVYVVERRPKDRSGYSKMIMYISKEKLSPLRVEYFDRREEMLKIATFRNFKQYQIEKTGKSTWRSNEIHMLNIQNEKQSLFRWNDRKLGQELRERDFTQQALN